jgi:hypothetical protein
MNKGNGSKLAKDIRCFDYEGISLAANGSKGEEFTLSRQIFSFKVFSAIIVSTHIVDNIFLIKGNIGMNRKLFQSGAATIRWGWLVRRRNPFSNPA